MELQKVNESALSTVDQISAVVEIKTNAEYEAAGELLLIGRGMLKEVKEAYAEPKKKSHEAWKAVVAAEKKYFDPVDKACKKLKRVMGEYQAEQERKRREKEREAQEALRKAEEEKRLQEAAQLENEGKNEQAEAIIEQPIPETPVILPKETPKVKGISFRENWNIRIDDPAKVPRQFCIPDEKSLRALAKAQKEAFNVEGVTAYKEVV